MTHFLQDIHRQPDELKRTLERLSGPGRSALDEAVAAVRSARHVYLTGIGSSWHAGLNVSALFQIAGRPVYLMDAAEMLQFASIPVGSVLIVISRSGRSVEIVQLLDKARESRAAVIGITNVPDGTLAREAQIPIVIPVALDHAISVNTYTTLALAAGVLAASITGAFDAPLAESLSRSFAATARQIPGWRAQIENSPWLAPKSVTYFLARGSSLGSAYEARLMWEEGVKSPATAMGAASFRHGPQEIVGKDVRFGIWIDATKMRDQDLALARDLRKLGARVMLIGQRLPSDDADLVFNLPEIPTPWQFVIDIIPAQLAAERLARLSGSDPDTFKLCSFIVEDESGLL
ncbi:MAG TPA: SIS domain-containing protein [Candidatus Acidoferrum sp.]|nr:SIS domain-containing protein [Candidatus Acidoferrum sp.]